MALRKLVKSRWALATAIVAPVAIVMALVASRPVSPLAALQDVVDEVLDGDMARGCADLHRWRGESSDDPGSIDRVDRGREALAVCVDHDIDAALTLRDAAERQDALLAIAHPHAALGANGSQLARIGASLGEDAPERIRLRSIEAEGPIELKNVRANVKQSLAAFQSCAAHTDHGDPAAQPADDAALTVRFHANPAGRVDERSYVEPDSTDARFADCLVASTRQLQLAPHDSGSWITLEFRLLP